MVDFKNWMPKTENEKLAMETAMENFRNRGLPDIPSSDPRLQAEYAQYLRTMNKQYPEDMTALPTTQQPVMRGMGGSPQVNQGNPMGNDANMRLQKTLPRQQMTPLEKQMGSVNPWGVRTFKKPEPRYEWKFDPTMRGVKNAGQEVMRQGKGFLGGVNNYFKKLANDPARLFQIQTSLALMNPNLRYDQGPKGLEVDNPWGAFSKALQVGQKSYMDAINRPLRYGQNSMGQIFDKQTGKVVSDGLGSAGGYLGTAEFAQNRNILLNPKANTRSPRYRSAYFGERQRQTRQFIDPTTQEVVSIRPDMSAYRPPAGYVPSAVDTRQRERTKPYSDAQMQAGGFYSRMLDATKSLESIYAGADGMYGTEDDLLPEDVFSDMDLTSMKVFGDYGNFVVSEKFQNAKQAMDNWVTANLRKESGAAIPPEEVTREYKKWFPSIGDKPSTIRQKAKSRKIAEDNMRATSQGAWERHWRDAQKELENVEGKTRTSNRKESRTNKKTKPDWIVDRAGNLKRNR